MNETILTVENLKVYFSIPSKNSLFKKTTLKAVDGVSFEIQKGETLGIVGESGCGKSTLARAILRLLPVTEGKITLLGEDFLSLNKKQLRKTRKNIQMIFQNPLASLNPKLTAGDIIAEPLKTHYPTLTKQEIKNKIIHIMISVGLTPEQINQYPHEFSGGQCQRIGIARSLILNPKIIVCDEPVSALDVSIQAQIINLLKKIQKEFGLSLIFISHNLNIVKHISDKVMVMYLGKAVEIGTKDVLYHDPKHPYTKALLSAIPIADPKLESMRKIEILRGDLPSPLSAISGCNFSSRCPIANIQCQNVIPTLKKSQNGSKISCLIID